MGENKCTNLVLWQLNFELQMIAHSEISAGELHARIRHAEIVFAGNKKLKIYGHLKCASGKRMKKENRLFFSSETEAKAEGYRPCGHCMREKYIKWKNGSL